LLIIIEGPDCAGKSTLAARLADVIRSYDDEMKVTLLHRGPPTGHPLDEYVAPLLSYRPGYRNHVICDRWHLGELVYPRVYRRSSAMTPGVAAYVELFLQSRGAYVVAMDCDDDYLRACGEYRGDPVSELELLAPANARFREVFAQTALPSTTVASGDVTELDVRAIIGEAKLIEDRVTHALGGEYTTYVGSPRPSLLLVGDRRGIAGEPTDYGDWPAFAPFSATSGDYLMTVLTQELLRVPTHGHLLSSLAFANANDVDNIRDVWLDVGEPPVIALGVNAARKLRLSDVPVKRKIPHPQYWKRFRHHEPDVYLQQLMGHAVAV
jgi:thymidylate kinase